MLKSEVKYVRDYLKLLNEGTSTRTGYGFVLNAYCKFLKKKSVKNVKRVGIEQFLLLETVKGARASANYYNYRLTILKEFFNYLIYRDVVVKNPCQYLKSKKIDKSCSKRCLSEDELKYILRHIKDKFAFDAITVLVGTGLRSGECASLRKSNFKLMRVGDVNRYVMTVKCKGGRVRTLIVRPEVIRICMSRIMRARHLVDAPVFAGRPSHKCITKVAFGNRVRKALRGAGIDEVTPHWFRHSFASAMQRRGMDVNSIRVALGHSNLGTTQVYLDELKVVDVSEVG